MTIMKLFANMFIMTALCGTLCAQTSFDPIKVKAAADRGSGKDAYEYSKYLERAAANDSTALKASKLKEASSYLDKAEFFKYPLALLEKADADLSGKINEASPQYTKSFITLVELAKLPVSQNFTRNNLNRVFSLLGRCYEYAAGIGKSPSAAFRFYALAAATDADAAAGLRRMLKNSPFSNDNRMNTNFMMLWKVNLADPAGKFDRDRIVIDIFENSRTNEFAPIRKNYLKIYQAYLERLANAGDIAAVEYLAEAFAPTDGILPQLKTQSANLSLIAADRGNREAALALGNIYSTGFGAFQKDTAKAVHYYKLATLSDNKDTVKAAGAALQAYYKDQKDNVNELRYTAISGDFKRAEEIIKALPELEFSNMNYYLKAKEFMTNEGIDTPAKKTAYTERVRFAAGTGSNDAIIELAKLERRTDEAKVIAAMEAEGFTNDAASLFELAKRYTALANKKTDEKVKASNIAKALEYYNKAAEMNSVDALVFFVRAYNSGNAAFGIERDVKKLSEYIVKTAEADYNMQYPDIFKNYLNLITRNDKLPTLKELEIIRRAAHKNPIAANYLANLYFTGNEELEIEKDVPYSVFLFSLAANDPSTGALAKLADIYKSGIPGESVPKDDQLFEIISIQRDAVQPKK